MAKKKLTEIKKSIDYIRIIDEMNDDAFDFCKSLLFQLTSYKVLKEEDIRPVDMKEWLLPFNDDIPNYREGRERGSLNFYMYLLQIYLSESLKCIAGSQAEMYKNRAIELIDKVLYKDHSLEDVDDIFVIFTGLFRFHKKNISQTKKLWLRNSIDPTLYYEDNGLFCDICNDYESEPDAILPYPNIVKLLTTYPKEKGKAKNFMFMNNIIFLARGLQKQGYFS